MANRVDYLFVIVLISKYDIIAIVSVVRDQTSCFVDIIKASNPRIVS